MRGDLHSSSSSQERLAGNALPVLSRASSCYCQDTSDNNDGLLGDWDRLYQRKGKVALFALVGALAGYLFSLPQTPVYRAATSLEVLEPNDSFLNMRTLDPNSQSYPAETRLRTEMKMLESKSLIRMVQDKLGDSYQPATHSERDSLSRLLESAGLHAISERPTRMSAIRMAAQTVKVRNPDLTRIVEITCESTDPEAAARFANELTQTYMDQSVQGRLNNNERTKEWLDQQIEEVKAKLQTLESQLVRYAQEADLLMNSESSMDRLKRLQEQLSTAQFNLIEKSSNFEVATKSPMDELPDTMQSDVLKTETQRLMQKQADLRELKLALAPGHYKVKRLEAEVQDLQERIAQEQQKVLSRFKNDFETARLREQKQEEAYGQEFGKLSEQSRKLIQYNMLKREVETHRQLYDSMLQKVKEAGIASAVRASNVRVVDPADVPKSPYKPTPFKDALTGLSSGLFLGVLWVFVRTSSDRRLRVPGQATAWLRVPELGAIPAGDGARAHGRLMPAARRWKLMKGGRETPEEKKIELATWAQAPSLQAESFRSVLVSLLSRSASKQRIFTVTSPHAGEGKTSLVCNLGIALAEIGKRAVLVDADMRRPRLHSVFEISNSWGLSDLLSDEEFLKKCPAQTLAKTTRIPSLAVLPSGPGTSNIVKLLYSSAMGMLLTRLREEFEIILIDTPAMMPFPEARVVAGQSDAVLMVVRAGITSRDDARTAVSRLAEDGVEILGAVLNGWNPKANGTTDYDKK